MLIFLIFYHLHILFIFFHLQILFDLFPLAGRFPFALSAPPSEAWRQVHRPPSHTKHCCGESVLMASMVLVVMVDNGVQGVGWWWCPSSKVLVDDGVHGVHGVDGNGRDGPSHAKCCLSTPKLQSKGFGICHCCHMLFCWSILMFWSCWQWWWWWWWSLMEW